MRRAGFGSCGNRCLRGGRTIRQLERTCFTQPVNCGGKPFDNPAEFILEQDDDEDQEEKDTSRPRSVLGNFFDESIRTGSDGGDKNNVISVDASTLYDIYCLMS